MKLVGLMQLALLVPGGYKAMKADWQFFSSKRNEPSQLGITYFFSPSSAISSISLMFHCSLQEQDTVLQHGPRWDGSLFSLHRPYRKNNPQPNSSWFVFPDFINSKPNLSSNALPASPGWTQLFFAHPLQSLPPGLLEADCPPGPSPPSRLCPRKGAAPSGWFWAQPLPHSPSPAGCEHTGAELCWGENISAPQLSASKSLLCLLVCFLHQQCFKNSWALGFPFP